MQLNLKSHLVIALLLSSICGTVHSDTLLSFKDARNDDSGKGNLVYPPHALIRQGDLDLTELQINSARKGFWINADFANRIASPSDKTTDTGPETLDTLLHKGFYAFNLDIYIDTDRISHSGNLFTLPGRKAAISPQHAWEKAIILSPRPESIRQQLLDSLNEEFTSVDAHSIETRIDSAIQFPVRIKVRNHTVSFFIPDDFITRKELLNASYTVIVTPAITQQPATWAANDKQALNYQKLDLGVQQIISGHSLKHIYTNDEPGTALIPVVDLLAPSVEKQEQQLAQQTVILDGVAQSSLQKSAHATSIYNLAELIGAQSESDKSSATETVKPVPDIAQRLKRLQALKDQSLISEDEYKEQRQRILNEL